ncbi:hypothetical protein [Geodermatophilus sp. SYSU D00815]
MRARRVATALVAFTLGAAASAALRRLPARRRPALGAAPVPAAPTVPVAPVLPVPDAVILPFPRPVAPAAPARCGDSGGVTKAGAPCAARPTAGGRCRHHRLAA